MKALLKYFFASLMVIGITLAAYQFMPQKCTAYLAKITMLFTNSGSINQQSEPSLKRAERYAKIEQSIEIEEPEIPVSFQLVHQVPSHTPRAKSSDSQVSEQVGVEKQPYQIFSDQPVQYNAGGQNVDFGTTQQPLHAQDAYAYNEQYFPQNYPELLHDGMSLASPEGSSQSTQTKLSTLPSVSKLAANKQQEQLSEPKKQANTSEGEKKDARLLHYYKKRFMREDGSKVYTSKKENIQDGLPEEYVQVEQEPAALPDQQLPVAQDQGSQVDVWSWSSLWQTTVAGAMLPLQKAYQAGVWAINRVKKSIMKTEE